MIQCFNCDGLPILHHCLELGGSSSRVQDWKNLLKPLLQEAGRLHLRCCCFELHGREGWGLQAGDHWKWESVCNHRIWHRSAKGLPLETANWSGIAAVPWRWWAYDVVTHSYTHTLELVVLIPATQFQLTAFQFSVSRISREVGLLGWVNILQNSTESRNMIISITHSHTSYLYTLTHAFTHHNSRQCGVNILSPLRA